MNNLLQMDTGSSMSRIGQRIFAAAFVVLRLLLPVIGLLGAYGISYLFQQPITIADRLFPAGALAPGYWLTLGHISIMLAFFAVMLTNRVFGPPYALAQVALSWLIVTAAWLLFADIASAFPGSPLPPRRVLWAFLIALGVAHIVNIVIFDQARGKPWWRAPFYGGLSAAVALPIVYWPIAKLGTEPFLGRMLVDLAVKMVTVYALLAPYALLRPFIRPRGGLGGY